jgi:hypothetical protein
MDPELKYTPIQLKEFQPQIMGIFQEEPQKEVIQLSQHTNRRASIAIHPTCDCSNYCCYLCCGCPELYTPDEMAINNTKITLCPLTSLVVNSMLVSDIESSERTIITHPIICLASPLTLIADFISFIPHVIIYSCSANK